MGLPGSQKVRQVTDCRSASAYDVPRSPLVVTVVVTCLFLDAHRSKEDVQQAAQATSQKMPKSRTATMKAAGVRVLEESR